MLNGVVRAGVVCVAILGLAPVVYGGGSELPSFQLVALRGQPAAGLPAGHIFYNFREPVISNSGLIAFAGDDRIASNNTASMWRGTIGNLALVARSGSFAPESEVGAGWRFSAPLLVGIDNAGQLAWRDRVSGPNGQFVHSIWRTDAAANRLVMRSETPAPGISGGQFGELDGNSQTYRQVFGGGRVGFYGRVTGAGIDALHNDALWMGEPGSTSLIVREGSPVPGAPAGAIFGPNSASSPYTPPLRMNATGTALFTGRTTPIFEGLWRHEAGASTLVAGSGTSLPGVSGAMLSPASFSLNNAGQVAFAASYGDGSRGIWRTVDGQLQHVAHQGEPAPGVPAGVVFATMAGATIDGSGSVAFTSGLSGPGVTSTNNSGLFKFSNAGSLQLIAREGAAAPGGLGAAFSEFGTWTSNASGAMAFSASLSGSSLHGVWVSDPVLGLIPIAVPGTPFQVATGDTRTILQARTAFSPETSSLPGFVSGGQDGLPTSFNDAGQLVLAIDFADNTSGLVVVTVPQPATGVIVGTLVFSALRRDRRRSSVTLSVPPFGG